MKKKRYDDDDDDEDDDEWQLARPWPSDRRWMKKDEADVLNVLFWFDFVL